MEWSHLTFTLTVRKADNFIPLVIRQQDTFDVYAVYAVFLYYI